MTRKTITGPYVAETTCCKCGSLEIGSRYAEAENYRSLLSGLADAPYEECIQRTCKRCHYHWYEAPIHAAPVPA